MFAILFLTFKINALLLFLGYGFAALFLPKALQKDKLWLSPWLGTVLLVVVGIAFEIGNFAIIYSRYFILALASFLLFHALFIKKVRFSFSKSDFFILMLILFAFGVNIYPLIMRAGFPTTISLGNLDAVTYTHTADFLRAHTVFEGGTHQLFTPYIWATGDLLHHGYRWGSPYILGFFASIFGVRAYELFSIMITSFFVWGFPLLYVLVKKIIQKDSIYTLFVLAAVYLFNSTLLYTLYNVFFGQFICAGIWILIATLMYCYVSDSRVKKNSILPNRYELLLAFSVSSITTIYPEGLLFVLGPLVIFALLSLSTKSRYAYLFSLFKIIILIILVNPFNFGTAIYQYIRLYLSATNTTFIGWEKIRYALPIEMMGFHNLFYSRVLPTWFNIGASLSVMYLWILGIAHMKNKLFLGAYVILFTAIFVFFGAMIPNYYTYFRTVTYSVFIWAVLYSVGFFFFTQKTKRFRWMGVLLFILIILASLRSMYRTVSQFYWHAHSVDKSLASLTKLNSNTQITEPFYTSHVFLGDYNLWHRLWTEYMLSDKKIVTPQNFAHEKKNLKKVKLILSEKNYLERDGKKIIYSDMVWNNEYYILGPADVINLKKEIQ